MIPAKQSSSSPGEPSSSPEVLHTFRKGGGSRPEVSLVRVAGELAVRKDFNRCDRWFAWLLGAALARRESAALERLGGLPGIPTLLKPRSPRVLLLERLAGTPMRERGGDYDWPLFFARLEALIASMHRRGVAHGDLRNLNNILIDEASRPALVDFVSSYTRRSHRNPVSGWVFRKLSEVDYSAAIKLKLQIVPGSLSPDERRQLRRNRVLGWIARGVRGVLRAAVRALTRDRNRSGNH